MRRCLVSVVVAAAACDDATVRLGDFELNGLAVEISAPASVGVGQTFVVIVNTVAGGCTGKYITLVDATEDGADVFPLDYDSHGNGGCPLILHWLRHEAAMKFDVVGNKEVRLHGHGSLIPIVVRVE